VSILVVATKSHELGGNMAIDPLNEVVGAIEAGLKQSAKASTHDQFSGLGSRIDFGDGRVPIRPQEGIRGDQGTTAHACHDLKLWARARPLHPHQHADTESAACAAA
jgi:hypothetical protein